MGKESRITYVAVIEDDESLSRSLARLLRVSGYHPVNYASAEAFLNDTKRPAFDCLVLDIQLEGMSGIELNQQLASTGSVTPVIFITAHENADELERSLSGCCAGFIRKSDPGDALITVIEHAIHAKDVAAVAPASATPAC